MRLLVLLCWTTWLWAAEPLTLTVMSHDSFALSKPLVEAFEKKYNAKVVILKSGDVGTALNQAILSKNNPLADVLYGVDNTFLTRAITSDIFESYSSPELTHIDPALILDKSHKLLPVDFGDVCLNVDKKWFADKKMSYPKSLDDLKRPEYKQLLVVQNPATSSPGLAFLLMTIQQQKEDGYVAYWKQLKLNGVVVANSWSDAYYSHFTHSKKGKQPIVVSYATSPAAEVYYSEGKLSEAPTVAILEKAMSYRQIEFVGILKGTKNLTLAKQWVDFMLSDEVQKDIPLQMWMYPARKKTLLPDVFNKFAVPSKNINMLEADVIHVSRQKWLQTWTETVL